MTTRLPGNLSRLAVMTALVWGAACSGGGAGGTGGTPGGTGKLSVHLVDGPAAEYAQVNVDVRAVEIRSGDAWITLATPHRVVNLLALTGGVVSTLADGVALPAGHYGELRLVLGPDDSVVLADGTTAPLKVPSGQQSGVKLPIDVTVAPGTTADVFIDFDAHRSVFVHAAGKSGKYILRPVVRAVDRVVTGSVEGQLVDAATGAPLPGVAVTAQVLDTTGAPSILRSTATGLDGHYALDLLPIGTPCFVVAQPVVGEAAYGALASPALTLTQAAPVLTYDRAFDAAAAVGGIAGTVTPAAAESDADTVVLWQTLSAGGMPHAFVIRTTPSAVAGGVESFGFTSLPAGDYACAAVRRTVDAGGNETTTAGAVAPVTVAGAAVAPVALTIP